MLGISDMRGATLRKLRWMADGHERAWRERFTGLGLLLYGHIKDVQSWIETGRVHVEAAALPPELNDSVARYSRAIQLNGGRFVMPDQVERILAAHGET